MKPAPRLALYLLIVSLIASAGIGYLLRTNATAEATAAVLTLKLPDPQGAVQDMAHWQGKIIVANYWATWCPPCREEIPDLSASADEFSAAPVQFVGISIDTAAKVQDFGREHAISYPLLIASRQVLDDTASFGNTLRALPFTLIIDRHGVVRHTHIGRVARKTLTTQIRALLAEQAGRPAPDTSTLP
ncbi:thioredoxin [Betaproteobacteria bacterium]|nr:thioredoxin [Betaproteobacteria bacterium]GHU00685.1 thioredoxin [Betaproteobacteria bacterium]GHU17674.1 thioredoxin [Betaproteobacteria bacterium]